MAKHVADSERAAGKSPEEARSIGYGAVVNRQKGRKPARPASRSANR